MHTLAPAALSLSLPFSLPLVNNHRCYPHTERGNSHTDPPTKHSLKFRSSHSAPMPKQPQNATPIHLCAVHILHGNKPKCTCKRSLYTLKLSYPYYVFVYWSHRDYIPKRLYEIAVIYANYIWLTFRCYQKCESQRLCLALWCYHNIYTSQIVYIISIFTFTRVQALALSIWLIARARNRRKTSTTVQSRHKPMHTFASMYSKQTLLPRFTSGVCVATYSRAFLRHQHRNVCRMLFLAHMPPQCIVKQSPTLSSYCCVGAFNSPQLSMGVTLTLSSRHRDHFPSTMNFAVKFGVHTQL